MHTTCIMLLKNNSNVCAQQILSILIAILIKFVTAFKNLMSYQNQECTLVWLANLCTSVILLLKKISNFQIIQCAHWLRVLRVKVGPVRSKKSDITLAYWWSCKDLVGGTVQGQVIWCTFAPGEFSQGEVSGDFSRWKPPSTFASSSLSRMHSSSMQWWSLCLYTRSQILEALRWASIALCCLISSCKWHQDRVVMSCHLSILATNDQIRQVSHSFLCAFWKIFFFLHIFWNQQPDYVHLCWKWPDLKYFEKRPTRKVWKLMICDQHSAFPT